MKLNIIFLLLFFYFSASAQIDREMIANEADSLYDARAYNESLARYNKLLSAKPNNSYYLSRRGLCYFNLKDYNKAKENFRLAILYEDVDDKKSLSVNYSNLSACYSILNEDVKAYDYALKAYYLDETPLTLFNAASLANSVKQYKKSIELLDNSKFEKHNDFNALYGRAYLFLNENEKSINYYETFFKNLDENNRFVKAISLLDEKYNLLQAYLYLLKNNIENKKPEKLDEQRIIVLSKEISTTEKNEKLKEIILYILNDTRGYNNPYSEALTKVFEALPNTLPTDKAIFYYRVKKFEKSQDYINKLEQEKVYKKSEDENLVKIYKYLNEFNLMLLHLDANTEKVNEDALTKVANLFSDYYTNKNTSDYEKFNSEEIYYIPIYETLLVLNKKSAFNEKAKKTILQNIFEKIPNEKMKAEILNSLKNTKFN